VFAADGNVGNINAVHGQKGCFVNCNVWLGVFFFFSTVSLALLSNWTVW